MVQDRQRGEGQGGPVLSPTFDETAGSGDDGVRLLVGFIGIKILRCQKRGQETGGEAGERLPAAVGHFGEQGFAQRARRPG